MDNKITNFTLKHSDISSNLLATSASSPCGYWTNGKARTTWYLNLKNLLGSQWDEYDEFMITLNQFSNTYSTYAFTTQDFQWIIKFSGLNFINTGYNQATNNYNGVWEMLNARVQNATPNTQNFTDIIKARFRKGDPYVALNFDIVRLSDGNFITAGTTDPTIPSIGLSFSITPIPKDF